MKPTQTTLLESSPAIESITIDPPAIETPSASQFIDLQETANQLSSSAKGLQKTALETKKPVFVSVQSLIKKLPLLEVLPPALTIFRLRATDSIFVADTLNVYELDGKAVLASPDLEVLEGFGFGDYRTGINGFCDVTYKGLTLRVNISVSDSHIETLIETGVKGVDGSGIPSIEYLRKFPQPEIPIYSDELPQNQALTIIGTGKTTQKWDTAMVDIQTPKCVVFKNVICNSELEKIVTKHGLGSKFKIIGKRAKVNKDGVPIDSEGKVNPKKPAYIVQIADMQGLDFSDL